VQGEVEKMDKTVLVRKKLHRTRLDNCRREGDWHREERIYSIKKE